MKYTIYEHLQMPNLGNRFYVAVDDNVDTEFHKVVGHADTSDQAYAMCEDIDESKLPSDVDVFAWHVRHSGAELAMFELNQLRLVRSMKGMK